MLRGTPDCVFMRTCVSESAMPVRTMPWLIRLNQSPMFWPRNRLKTWPRSSPIQISSASKVSLKKFADAGRRRATAGHERLRRRGAGVDREPRAALDAEVAVDVVHLHGVRAGIRGGRGDDLRGRQAEVAGRREVEAGGCGTTSNSAMFFMPIGSVTCPRARARACRAG